MTAHAGAEPAAPRRSRSESVGGGQDRPKEEESEEEEEGGSTGLPEDVTVRRRGCTHDPDHQDDGAGRRDNENNKYTIVAMYKFQRIEESRLENLKSDLVELLQRHEAFGNLLLATEGINGTVCYPTTPVARGGTDADRGCDEGDSKVDDVQDDPVRCYLRERFPNAMMRVSHASQNVFFRLRIRIKNEVVTMGVPDVHLVAATADDVDEEGGQNNGEGSVAEASPKGELGVTRGTDRPGAYVSPSQWNELLKDPSTLVVDTRNEYEINVGTFENAINPHTTSFVEFPSWLERQLLPTEQDKALSVTSSAQSDALEQQHHRSDDGTIGASPSITKLAFFCTGGVRCEKATAYAQRLLKEQQRNGPRQSSSAATVPEVYHLEGGILGYLESVSPEESMFMGECYVFDNRVAVTHGLQPTTQYQACRACRHPLSPEDIASDTGLFLEGRQCRYCASDPDKEARRSRYEMRHQQVSAAHQKGHMHLGSHSLDALRAKQKAQNKAAALGASNAGQHRDL
jgi:UPF0176 protein